MDVNQANIAIEKGEFDTAIKILTELIKKEPNNIQYLGLRGISYRRIKKFVLSIKDFDAGITADSNNADLHSEKGVTLFHQSLTFEALAEMNRAVEIEPNNPYRYSSRAYIKNALKDVDGAIADYEKAIELDPEDAIAMNNLGMLQEKQGNKEQAQKRFDRSDEIEGVDYKPADLSEQAVQSGGTSLNENDAQKEVLNLSQRQREDLMNEVKITENKNTVWKVIKGVFTDRDQFNEFVQYLKDFFIGKNKD